jgi:hypothetical protein
MTIHYSRALIVLPFVALLGCASGSTDDSDESVAESAEEIVTSNRLTMNRLTMNRLTMNSLSATKLTQNGQQLTSTTLASTEDGREVLRYLIRCALPEGTSLTSTVNGTTYVFPGLLGLASAWQQGPLTGTGRRWVSACLLAHVNGYGIQVPISVRGNHSSLTADSGERNAYQLQEVSFFGDLFTTDDQNGDGSPDSLMFACGGQSVQTACGGSQESFRPARSCASADDCAIQFVGACRDISGANAHVCGSVLTDGYSKCHTSAQSSGGFWPYGQVYNEVITVYMSQTDFNSFYTGCVPLAN